MLNVSSFKIIYIRKERKEIFIIMINITEVSLEQYNAMTEQEKENFFNKVSQSMSSSSTFIKAVRQKKTKNMKIKGYKQPNGRLTFIEELRRTDKHVTNFSYLCLCECGNWYITTNRHFDIEDTISCGCYRKEKSIEIARELGYKNALPLQGEIIGDLEVIEKTSKRVNEKIVWKCKCINCGAEQEVQGSLLNRGIRVFCEQCSQRKSRGEKFISTLLNIIGFNYVKEYSFLDCRFPDTGRPAKFDFYVNNKYIIEFDGIQHFKPERFNNISEEEAKQNFIKTKEHDAYKNEYCKQHNISIIRIPYTHVNEICLEDLIPETSKFTLSAF